MRRVGLVALIISLQGCQEDQPGVADELRYFVPSHVERLDPGAVEFAEDIFGLELVEQGTAWGAVTVFPFERDDFGGPIGPEFDGAKGRAVAGRCTSWFWYLDEFPETFAHELGHTYGLEHVDSPFNLMEPALNCDPADLTISDSQFQTIRETSWLEESICNSLPPPP